MSFFFDIEYLNRGVWALCFGRTMSTRIRIKSLKADQKAEAYLNNAKLYLESHGAPAELISTLEQLWRSAVEKNVPGKLTPSERLALLAVRYFAAPGGTGADVRRESKPARYVQSWLKRSGKDIESVDTPTALEDEQLLKALSRKKRWDVILGLLNGTITFAQAKEEAQKRKPRAPKAEAGTKPRRRSRKAAEEAPATPAPVPEAVGAPVEEKPVEVKAVSGGEEEASKEAEAVAEQILAEGLI